MKTFKTAHSWGSSELSFESRLNDNGKLEVEFDDNDNYTHNLYLDKDQIRELIDHLKSVLDEDETFQAPGPAGKERITFRGAEYIVDRVDVESSFDDYTTWDGFGLARINTNRKMTLTVRPVPPKPQPGDFKSGDMICVNGSESPFPPSYRVFEIDGEWYIKYPDTKRLAIIKKDLWVRAY